MSFSSLDVYSLFILFIFAVVTGIFSSFFFADSSKKARVQKWLAIIICVIGLPVFIFLEFTLQPMQKTVIEKNQSKIEKLEKLKQESVHSSKAKAELENRIAWSNFHRGVLWIVTAPCLLGGLGLLLQAFVVFLGGVASGSQQSMKEAIEIVNHSAGMVALGLCGILYLWDRGFLENDIKLLMEIVSRVFS